MEKKETTKFYKIITFPEQLSNLLLVIFAIILIVFDTLVVLFIVPKVDYTYLPNYSERLEYDWMNPYVRSITGYYEDDNNEVYSSMTVTFCYFGVDTNHKATRTIGSFTVIDENDDIYYVGDLSRSTNTTYSTTSTPLSRLSKPLSGIKTFYGKVEYDQMMGGEKRGTDVIYFKEETIDLDKKKVKSLSFCDESEIESVISVYNIIEKDEDDKLKITNKFEFKGNLEFNYHLDYQLFGVDKSGSTYDLIGIYNFTNNYSKYLSLDTRIPKKIEIDYYIGVFKIIIGQEEKVLYIRKAASQE